MSIGFIVFGFFRCQLVAVVSQYVDIRNNSSQNSGAKHQTPVQNPGATPVHELDYTGDIIDADSARLAEKARE